VLLLSGPPRLGLLLFEFRVVLPLLRSRRVGAGCASRWWGGCLPWGGPVFRHSGLPLCEGGDLGFLCGLPPVWLLFSDGMANESFMSLPRAHWPPVSLPFLIPEPRA
jgi:hypothetical protein